MFSDGIGLFIFDKYIFLVKNKKLEEHFVGLVANASFYQRYITHSLKRMQEFEKDVSKLKESSEKKKHLPWDWRLKD